MKKNKKIEISISNEKLDLLRKMGLTPEDVFSQGFKSLMRRKYREISMVDDDDEEDIELMEINELPRNFKEIDEFLINDNDIANN